MFADVYFEMRVERMAFASETCLRAFLMAAMSSLEMLDGEAGELSSER